MGEVSQKELILQSPSRRIVVLACPGSGKTTTLTEKIIRLVKEKNVSLKRVLSVTFTRKAAGEMLDRIKTEIPISKSERRNICTLHAFGTRVLLCFKDLAGLAEGYTIADSDDAKEVLSTVIPEEQFIGDFPEKFLAEVSEIKNGMKSAGEGICTKEAFDAYCEAMRIANLIDIDDLIYLPTRILSENPAAREEVASWFDYVFVDEYQDINRVQDELLSLIIRDDTYVMYVGDDDQSIYGFRGSNSDFILKKSQEGSGYDVFYLTTNYRSQKPIVEFSKEVISGIHSSLRMDKTIIANKNTSSQKPIRHTPFLSKQSETDFVSGEIRRLITTSEVQPKEIAVLSRYGLSNQKHTELSTIEGSLRAWGIPVFSGFARDGAREKAAAVKTICKLLPLLKSGKLSPSNMNLLEANAYQKKNYAKVIEAVNETCGTAYAPEDDYLPLMSAIKASSPQLDGGLKVRLDRYLELYDFLSTESSLVSQGAMPSQVITDLLQFYEERKKGVETIRYVFENAFSFARSCEDALDPEDGDRYASVSASLNTFLASEGREEITDGVSLLTAHQSKGLQFDVVFVVGLEAGSFPCDIDKLTPAALDDERRLFYVCVTRARELLYLTSTGIADDPSAKGLAEKSFVHHVDERYFSKAIPSLEGITFSVSKSENLERLKKKDEVIEALETNYEFALERLRSSDEVVQTITETEVPSGYEGSELEAMSESAHRLLEERGDMQSLVERQSARILELRASLDEMQSSLLSLAKGQERRIELEKSVDELKDKLERVEKKKSEAEALAQSERKRREESESRLAQESTRREAIESVFAEYRRAQSEVIKSKSKVDSAMDAILSCPKELLPGEIKTAVDKIYRVFVRDARFPLLRQYFAMAISGFDEMVAPCGKYRDGAMERDIFMSFIRPSNYKGQLDVILRGILSSFEPGSAKDKPEFNLGAFIDVALGKSRERRYAHVLKTMKKQGYDLSTRKVLLEDMRVLNALTSSSSHGGAIANPTGFAAKYDQIKSEFLMKRERLVEVLGSYFVFITLFLKDEDIFRMIRMD